MRKKNEYMYPILCEITKLQYNNTALGLAVQGRFDNKEATDFRFLFLKVQHDRELLYIAEP